MKEVVERLNKIFPDRWGKWNDRQGLTVKNLYELLKQPSSKEFHAIRLNEKVRTSFPNLRVMRRHNAKQEVSICDAVWKVLNEHKLTLSYQAVVSAWKGYKTKQRALIVHRGS